LVAKELIVNDNEYSFVVVLPFASEVFDELVAGLRMAFNLVISFVFRLSQLFEVPGVLVEDEFDLAGVFVGVFAQVGR
jgi:hypothetical protein